MEVSVSFKTNKQNKNLADPKPLNSSVEARTTNTT